MIPSKTAREIQNSPAVFDCQPKRRVMPLCAT
nr:MAG TPA: hypothetical protein [Caudoviricetes sp.]